MAVIRRRLCYDDKSEVEMREATFGLSCGIICVILCSAVLILDRSVTDRQTDTHRHTTTAYTALAWRRAVKTGVEKREATFG